MPKISAKFRRGHPQRGRQIEGYVQIGDFWPIFRYISKTVQYRDIVSYYGTLIETCMRFMKWRYFQWPWVTLIYPEPPHFVSLVITWWVEMETLNLVDELIVASGKPSMKGAWSGHVNHLNFGRHEPYLWNGLSYSRQILYAGGIYQVLAFGRQTTP